MTIFAEDLSGIKSIMHPVRHDISQGLLYNITESIKDMMDTVDNIKLTKELLIEF